MALKKFHQYLVSLSVVFFLGLAIALWLPTQVQAQSQSMVSTANASKPLINPGPQAPMPQSGGGTRGECTQDKWLKQGNPPLTLLTSTDNPGLTSLKYPIFWVYVPPTSATEAEFTLVAQGGKSGYRTTFPLTNIPGVVSFRLPSEAPPPEFGKAYTWKLALICNPGDRTQDVVQEAQIQFTN